MKVRRLRRNEKKIRVLSEVVNGNGKRNSVNPTRVKSEE